MDENIARPLRAVKDFKELAQFEINARRRVTFDDEIEAAFKSRGEELARQMIASRTGLDLSQLTPAEDKIVRAVSEYLAIKRRDGSDATRTILQLRNRGLIEAAEIAVSKSKPTQGFETLHDEDLDELSYEQIVVDHPEEFSPRANWYSRRTLGLPNATDKPPARRSIAVQTRTEELLAWLAARAAAGEGLIASFANAEAAAVLGMNDMTRHGRVYGNIQSRLDFACYRRGLPPLGLTADSPFSEAWQPEDRTWIFPVPSMQRAAQTFRWRAHDFERLVAETATLPGQAHVLWKADLREREAIVRAWAEGLESGPRESAAPAPDTTQAANAIRNPDWTREEHILGIDLYLRLRGTSYPDEHPEVIELSETLRRLAALRGMSGTATFRNANGVSMKMLNFRRVDPSYKGTGLPSGSKLEVDVWNEFAAAPDALAAAVEAILYDIEMAKAESDVSRSPDDRYWVLVCNPAKWAVDKFLSSGKTSDSWGVRPADATKFAPGQLAVVRVGVDRRIASARDGRGPLEPGIYAICEIDSVAYPGTGASDDYWANDATRAPGWPTVKIRYLRNYLDQPLSIERLRTEKPALTHLLLNGFQAASFPLPAQDFHALLELLGEDEEGIAGDPTSEDADTLDRLADLESRYLNASPEVKTRVSKGIERGPIGREVKRLNGFKCQLCEGLGRSPLGFRKRNGEHYVEAHHVMPVHRKEVGSLSAANIVTLCANHHREVHYGAVEITIEDDAFSFVIDGRTVKIPRPKVKLRVGVLAYGSLIDNPGPELKAVTIATIRNVTTPFAIEYARSSSGREGAPTLVPVSVGGAKVTGCIYEVSVDENTARDILYRRETGKIGTGVSFAPPEAGNTKKMAIDRFVGLGGLNAVISTRLAANVDPLTAENLSKLAIQSARKLRDGRDGISYLMNATKSGISTPLTAAYAEAILKQLGVTSLAEAIEAAGRASSGDSQ